MTELVVVVRHRLAPSSVSKIRLQLALSELTEPTIDKEHQQPIFRFDTTS